MEAAAGAVQATRAKAELEELATSGLSPVEKVLALQRVPLFSRVSAEEMRQLADISQTVTLETGKPLFAESASPGLWVILKGELALESSSGTTLSATSGDVLGAMATMAGRPLGLAAAAARSGVALRIDRDDLFTVLGERTELLRQMFSGMFKEGTGAFFKPARAAASA
jgi:CRP-like cAMP-binding protein